VNIVPDSSKWEEEAVWVDDADITEEHLLSWQHNLQVKAWGVLLENKLNNSLVMSRVEGVALNGTARWGIVWPQVDLQHLNDIQLHMLKDLWHIDVLVLKDNLIQDGGLNTNNLFQFSNDLGGHR